MRSVLAVAAVGLAFALASCAPIDAHGEFVPNAPYAEFMTFSFAKAEGPPSGFRSSPRSALIVEQMKPLVAQALEAKGYRRAPDGEGDIIVACGAGRRDVEEHVPLPRRLAAVLGENEEDQDFVERGLVIDAFDKSGGQIWHGAARTDDPDPHQPSPERLRRAVDAALSRFPKHPAHQ